TGYIKKCLIPFEPTFGDKFKRGKVVGINVQQQTVTLASGETIHYDELVIATGTTGKFPSKLPVDTSASEAIARYEDMVAKVQKAQDIVLIGGGAVGVELSGDIKEDYKEKEVTLIHPREIIVNDRVSESFQNTVKERLKTLGVKTMLEGKSFIISAGRSGGAVQMGNWVFGDWLSRTIKGNSVFTPMQWKAMGQEMPK
ncbi:apoptosis-inducing factor 2, partial [Exaiptasia diaphana]|uniref:Ferroptosis suppressor protein 1 n=1 Tax=Exaiptasia diaphana TaxID=2652724 RepID=A0A913WWL1_EXADI